jgi:prevent-host-death family protein
MKFISVRDLRLKPAKVWKMAKEERDIVLTVNGRPVAILTGVDEDSFEAEVEAIRRARALQALESLQLDSLKKGTHRIAADKVQAQIRARRKTAEG